MAIDEERLGAFMGQAVTDMSAAISVALMYIGDKLGLYKGMAGAGPVTPAELAEKTGTSERYVREWLSNQFAGGYVTYDPAAGAFELPEEQAFALANEDSPVFLGGVFDVLASCWADVDTISDAFKSGKGVGWHEHDHRLFHGTERFGYDYHDKSIDAARKAAVEAGITDRVTFEVASAADFDGTDFDIICFFDCLHDMGDPVGAASHAREALAADGTILLVEPYANDNLEDNVNPVGRMFYGASTMLCTPASLSQEVGLALGAQAGEARLADVAKQAGLTTFRRATETPFNLVLEAKA